MKVNYETGFMILNSKIS